MPLRLGEGVPICELEAVDEREEELVVVCDELAVPLRLGEGVPVEEPEGVSELEGERVKVSELVVLALLVDDNVGAGDALRRLAMLRPRYVMEDTAASASPASHSVDS